MFAIFFIKSVLIILLETVVINVLKHFQDKTESEVKLKIIYVSLWISVLLTILAIILFAVPVKN